MKSVVHWFAVPLVGGAVVGILVGLFAHGVAICPSNQPVRAECFVEARQAALGIAFWIGLAVTALIALIKFVMKGTN